jgi:hypothetical protein
MSSSIPLEDVRAMTGTPREIAAATGLPLAAVVAARCDDEPPGDDVRRCECGRQISPRARRCVGCANAAKSNGNRDRARVLRGQGLSDPEIARELGVSSNTVRAYFAQARRRRIHVPPAVRR